MKKRLITAFLAVLFTVCLVMTSCNSGTVTVSPEKSPSNVSESSKEDVQEFSKPTEEEPSTPSEPDTTEEPTESEPFLSETESEPSEKEERDPAFDLKPTGTTTVKKSADALKSGNLILVDASHPYDPNAAKPRVIIRAERTGNINVSEFGHSVLEEVFVALEKLEADLEKKTGTQKTLIVTGAWRDEASQKAFNEKYGNIAGFTADPLEGSEHYTGLCVDLRFWDGQYNYHIGAAGVVEESKWLLENIAAYGFIPRYTPEKVDLTGHKAETGHFRYVGVAHASYMVENNLCLEEYLNLLRKHGPNNRLVVTDVKGNMWSVYYVSASSDLTEIPVPEGVVYEISGDNEGGFIVSVKSVWTGDLVEKIPVSGIRFAKDVFTLNVGESFAPDVVILPENVEKIAYTLSSSDPEIASVGEDGKVTAQKPGNVILTVTTLDGGFSANAILTVTEPEA